MRQKKNLFLLVGLILIGLPLRISAQDWQSVGKEEVLQALKSTNQKMLKAKTLEMEMVQTVYDITNNKVLASGNGFFKRKDSLFLHTRILGVETIQNRDYKLLIDSGSKTILLNRPSPLTPSIDLANIESFFKVYPIKNTKKKVADDKSVSYMVEFETGGGYPVESLTFTHNGEGLITDFEMLLNKGIGEEGDQKSRVTIRYFNYKLNENIDSDDFSLNTYLTFNKGVAQPVKAFSAYEFVNTSGK